jgi:pimeloyl-ACP methyl ester carboxylesterase
VPAAAVSPTDRAGQAGEPVCSVRTVNPHRPNGRTAVLVHGAWHSGAHYLETFDGRPGWAYDFAAAGYRVLLPDWPGTGRSPAVSQPDLITAEYICQGLGAVIDSVVGPVDLLVHSMSGPYGFRLLETHGTKIENLVAVAPGMPAEMAEPPQSWEDLGDSIRTVWPAGESTFPKRGWTTGSRSFIVDHCIGASTRMPPVDPAVYEASLFPLWGGLSAELLASMLAGTKSDARLSGRVLVIIGTHDAGHPKEHGDRLAAWLRQHGARAHFTYLGDAGIQGNGHMLMLEDNSAEIAAVILSWLLTRPDEGTGNAGRTEQC